MTEVSSTRLYLGNLPRNATKADVEAHFNTHGTGEITEIKLMNGFGFIEYKDAMDARDVVPAFHGSDFMGERLTVQFARGTRARDTFAATERIAPRPRRTPHRMQISGLPGETSWQDLKDFARQSSLDVVYSETGRDRDGKGSFVEFETAADLKAAVEKLDGREFKGVRVTCIADVCSLSPTLDLANYHRLNRIFPVTVHDPDPQLPAVLTPVMITTDVALPADTALGRMLTVIEALPAVGATMRTIVVDTVLPRGLVDRLTTIHLPVAGSRIRTAVITHLTLMSMVELLMIVLHQETILQEMLRMITRDQRAVTGNFAGASDGYCIDTSQIQLY
ncbi:hypothetical protein JHW43_003458 [Diplocarpon mali]|nr:hypothetical protein JHW43_003458 [Diplocarpon mali]